MRRPLFSLVSLALPLVALTWQVALLYLHRHLPLYGIGIVVPVAGLATAVASFTRNERHRWLAVGGFVLNLLLAPMAALM